MMQKYTLVKIQWVFNSNLCLNSEKNEVMVGILTMKQEWMWEGVNNVDTFFGQHIVCILL